jgi:hypothetical protein
MFFRVDARDDYIGPNCNVTERKTSSDTISKNVADFEPPTISDNSLKNVACHAVIRATILDGANGKDGIYNVIAEYAEMNSVGGHDILKSDFVSQSGPDAEGRYTWEINQLKVQDWSMPDTDPTTFDNKPDLYYTITAYDTCGNSVTIPVNADDHSTEITVTETDVNPPLIVLNYDGNGFQDCVPYGSESGIPISFDVTDDCEVTKAAYAANQMDLPPTCSIDDFSSFTSVNAIWGNITDALYPKNRNDLWFRTFASDSNANVTMNPTNDAEPCYNVIHQGNALWYNDPLADPIVTGDVALEGTYDDTVILSLKNYRDGDIYLDSLYLKEPAYKNICLSTGDTSVAFPYVDTITLESQNSDASDYKRNVIWDWNRDEPTPGTRDRGPITLYFNKVDPDALLISGYGREVTISIHFMDKQTDNPYQAIPFSIKECDFDLIFQSDQSKEYKCDNEFIFSTKTTGLYYPPNANAGTDKVTTVNASVFFEGRMSADCDNDITDYEWNFEPYGIVIHPIRIPVGSHCIQPKEVMSLLR